jgi:hypothetical protein
VTHGSARPRPGAARWPALATAFLLACGNENPGGPPDQATGDLRVTTTTTGPSIDADGYRLVLDQESNQPLELPIPSNGSVTFADLVTGQHSLTVAGVRVGCAVTSSDPPLVDATTLLVQVVARDTADVQLALTCDGAIAISVASAIRPGGLLHRRPGLPCRTRYPKQQWAGVPRRRRKRSTAVVPPG